MFDSPPCVCYNSAMSASSKNIILVGFMGAGKSVTAKRLQALYKRKLVSTDALIEEREKRPITQIFKDSGEPYFRSVEKAVVEDLSRENNLIIDCGGGVVLNQENIDNLKRTGIMFYLKATAEITYDRVKNEKHRPLLNVADPKAKIKELLDARQSSYAKAHCTIDTSHKTIDQVVDEILNVIKNDRT